jgi:23S rRNA (uracil1939-C5)-methyltransferase
MAHYENRAWFCLGALPGELCEVSIVRQSKSYVICRLEKVLKPSKCRETDTVGSVYAPWQPVDYAYQLELKQGILTDLFGRPELRLDVSDIIGSPLTSEYRNKLTFALVKNGTKYELAMHQRGSKETYPTPAGCDLGHPSLNNAALAVLERLNASEIGDNAIGLTMRRSSSNGDIIAILHLTKRYKIDFQSLRAPGLAGLVVAVNGEAAWSYGASELTESILGIDIAVPAHEFMQVNIPAFELTLAEISSLITDNNVLDLYGGAGTIGIPLAQRTGAKVLSVELNLKSVELSRATAKKLDLSHFKATSSNADSLPDSIFMNIDTVIVDPPRAGLSRDLIDQLIRLRIEHIIYLSCDPATQARDAALLREVYKPSAVTGFDFYPGTPHLESLMNFELITKLPS